MQLRRQLDAAEMAARTQLRNARDALQASADLTSGQFSIADFTSGRLVLEPLPHAHVFMAAAAADAPPAEAERVLQQLHEAERALSRAIDVAEARLVPGGSPHFRVPCVV